MQNTFSRFKWILMLQAKTNVKYLPEHNLKVCLMSDTYVHNTIVWKKTKVAIKLKSVYLKKKVFFAVYSLKAKCITRCYYA